MNKVLMYIEKVIREPKVEIDMTQATQKNALHAALIEFQREYNRLITRTILLFGKREYMKRKKKGIDHDRMNIYPTLFDLFDIVLYPKVESIYYDVVYISNILKEISLDGEDVDSSLSVSNNILIQKANQLKTINVILNVFRDMVNGLMDEFPEDFDMENTLIDKINESLNDTYWTTNVRSISDYKDNEVTIHVFTKAEELKDIHDKFILKMSRMKLSYNWFS